MEEIQKMFPAEINHGVWAEGLRHAGGMEKIKKSVEKKKPITPDILDEHGKVGEKPDIIRQTHIRMFHDNLSKGEMERKPEALHKREKKEQRTTKGKEKPNEIVEPDEDKFERIGDQAMIPVRKTVRKPSSAGGAPQGHDVQYLMRLYMGAETGIYKTKDGVKVTVFKDPKSKLTYLTFLIPLNGSESDEVSVFLNPENPERANMFKRRIEKDKDR